MADDAAWQAGVDIGTEKKSQKKKNGSSGNGKKEILGDLTSKTPNPSDNTPKLHKGGRVKRTGNYRLRKKEVVLTVAQQKAAGIKRGKKKSSVRKRVASKG
jgi:hypothetical protein